MVGEISYHLRLFQAYWRVLFHNLQGIMAFPRSKMAVDKRYKHELIDDDTIDKVELVRDQKGFYSVIEVSDGIVVNQILHGYDYEEASYNFDTIVTNHNQ